MRGPRSAQSGGQTTGAQSKEQPGQGRRQQAAAAQAQSFDERERLSFRMPSEQAKMWRDYRIFKAAGLLHQWERIYAAVLPINFRHRPKN